MNKIAIAVHGGAGEVSDFVRDNKESYEEGLKAALYTGHKILSYGGSALEAVRAAVRSLEDNPLFNAGRGAAWNIDGDITHDASIMDGKNRKAGAAALIHSVKNPIELAYAVMTETNHVLLAGSEAVVFAKQAGLPVKEEAYFKTKHQEEEFLKAKAASQECLLKQRNKGTVGAVALDEHGNLAAATSTGGTSGRLPGRVGDSCIIGGGCFADNNSCAVSGTGDGEFLITGVIAHSIAMMVELKQVSLQEACDYIIHEKNKNTKGDMGVISINTQGVIGIAYNSGRMHRAWIDAQENEGCEVI